jgi:hypothetical protein
MVAAKEDGDEHEQQDQHQDDLGDLEERVRQWHE